MLSGNFIGGVHAPLSPCKTTPCWPTGWSDRAARPTEDQTVPAAYFARAVVTAVPSRLPAKPSFRATETAPAHDHGERWPEALRGAGFRTPAPSRSADPKLSLAEVHHRFFFRPDSARSMGRGLIETPKRFRTASITSFSVVEVARHCSTKSSTSSVHLCARLGPRRRGSNPEVPICSNTV